MFQEHQIAMAIHTELDKKYSSPKLIEGMTVEVLSSFDQAVLAVRAALTRTFARMRQMHMPFTRKALVSDHLPTF